MRAQFFDGFDFATYKFSIVAIEEVDDFFNIEEFGLHPIMYNEACLRGYTAIFGFNDEKMLTLHKLLTNNNGMEPPAIDGIHPVSFHSPAGDLKYELNHVMDYSGSILIANSFIDKYFVPFGFQLPHGAADGRQWRSGGWTGGVYHGIFYSDCVFVGVCAQESGLSGLK